MKGIEIITLYYSEQHHEFFPNRRCGARAERACSLCRATRRKTEGQSQMDSKRNIPVGAKVIARQIDSRDAEVFISRMHTNQRTKQEQRELAHYALQEGGRPKVNYVKGRKSGQFPTLEIVRLELELFVKLKSYHRKLV